MRMQVVLRFNLGMMMIWVVLIALPVHGSAGIAVSPESSPPRFGPKRHGKPVAAASPKTTISAPSPYPHSPTKVPFAYKRMRPSSVAIAPSVPSFNGPATKRTRGPAFSNHKHHHHHHTRSRLLAPAPAPAPTILSRRVHMPIVSPAISPLSSSLSKTRIHQPPPFLALPPPPPNQNCASITCPEPLTYAPPGPHCGCVRPIQVNLHLSIELYTFFPLVSKLAKEIAASLSLNHSQVRIMGANAAKQQLDKTSVLIDLVPIGHKFNHTTSFVAYEKFWDGNVSINDSLFGAYEVVYVRYPGLPPSPPSGISVEDEGPYNGGTVKPLGVEVPRTKKEKEKELSKSMIAVIVLSSFTAFVVCVGGLFVSFGACVRRREQIPHTLLSSQLSGSAKPMICRSKTSSSSISFASTTPTYTGSVKTFTLIDIERATNNFDASSIVGEGGFGIVYRGILDNGREVAVKVLKREDQRGGREFLSEVEMLGRLHHRNLVKLIAICTEGHVRCLVYELVPNGSVESHLHGVDKETSPLDWDARVKIALGAARGLAYLHEDSSPRVIHRDFKSSNILLEHDFTPKVSDFGLARAAHDEGNMHISTHVMGTFGYLAPEYAMTGHLLVKSDVYSYGVVLLELLTGRKPVDLSQPGQENLVAWALPLLTSREGLETIIDSNIRHSTNTMLFESVAKVAAIASMCVQPEVSNRPFMGEVVQALQLVCSENDERIGQETQTQSLTINVDGTNTMLFDSVKVSEDTEVMGLSRSDLEGHEEAESSRRHSSWSGSTQKRQFWERLRSLSGGGMSEHESSYKPWPGSH